MADRHDHVAEKSRKRDSGCRSTSSTWTGEGKCMRVVMRRKSSRLES